MEIRQDDPTSPHVAGLLAHHLQELQSVMAEYAFALDATGLSAAEVTFWTAWQGSVLVGFGALKELDGTHGEVKSMRAAPAARGMGLDGPCSTTSLQKPGSGAIRGSAWKRERPPCMNLPSRSTVAPGSYRAMRSPTTCQARKINS